MSPSASETGQAATIRVNGEVEPFAAATLAALIEAKAPSLPSAASAGGKGGGQRGIAVALNGAVVPRAAWPQTALRPGDSVEIVRARQGG